MSKIVKKMIYLSLKLYELSLGKVLYSIAKKYTSLHTKLLHYTDWYFSDIKPSSYKHEINLYNWIYDPSQCQFAEGGVFGRMLIKPNDYVLDLCSGDGSYAYLFFSDIAHTVDAIDYSEVSIEYARKNYGKNNINYICANLLQYQFASKLYDVIMWGAGVAYFTQENRKTIFNKIHASLKDNGKVYIRTPLENKANYSANQIEVIIDESNFEKEFKALFNIVLKQKTFYNNRINLNYILEKI